jgi:hypothetical protein
LRGLRHLAAAAGDLEVRRRTKGRSMRYTFGLLTLAALVFVAGCRKTATTSGTSSASTGPDRPLAVWKPDATFLEQLEPIADVDEYQVRPPQGYSFSPPPATPPGVKGFAWKGAQREDQTAPQLMIGLVSRPPEEVNVTVEQYLDNMLEGVKRRRTNWTQTSPERGQVNGLTFVRARWSGTEPERQSKMHGFMYVAKDGSTFIHISSQDLEPHHEQALMLAEIAALTFKKK